MQRTSLENDVLNTVFSDKVLGINDDENMLRISTCIENSRFTLESRSLMIQPYLFLNPLQICHRRPNRQKYLMKSRSRQKNKPKRDFVWKNSFDAAK